MIRTHLALAMFTVVKVRRNQKPGDYSIPAGTRSRPAHRSMSGQGL